MAYCLAFSTRASTRSASASLLAVMTNSEAAARERLRAEVHVLDEVVGGAQLGELGRNSRLCEANADQRSQRLDVEHRDEVVALVERGECGRERRGRRRLGPS